MRYVPATIVACSFIATYFSIRDGHLWMAGLYGGIGAAALLIIGLVSLIASAVAASGRVYDTLPIWWKNLYDLLNGMQFFSHRESMFVAQVKENRGQLPPITGRQAKLFLDLFSQPSSEVRKLLGESISLDIPEKT